VTLAGAPVDAFGVGHGVLEDGDDGVHVGGEYEQGD
jgi:hypothetical protein